MTTVQCAPPDVPPALVPELRDLDPPPEVRPRVDWGLGWEVKGTKRQLGGAPHPDGDLTSPDTFSHGGATGTMVWADPGRMSPACC